MGPATAQTRIDGKAEVSGCGFRNIQPGSLLRLVQLLKRAFDFDIAQCPHCGAQLKLIAAIEEPAVVQCILTRLGLAA